MSIARVSEVKSSSQIGFDDAIEKGIAHANKTLKNVRGPWIWNREVLIDKKRQDVGVPRSDEGKLHSRRPSRKQG